MRVIVIIIHSATGVLYPVPLNPWFSAQPGKFLLAVEGVPNLGFYWIIALGDINDATGLYEWSSKKITKSQS
jgi:hypothetical protein